MSYADLANHDILTRDEEYALIRQAQAGDIEARDELWSHNVKLILDIAGRYTTDAVTVDELVADGTIGFFDAVEKFDFTFNTRLLTYAYRYIQGAICESELLAGQVDAPAHWRYKTLPDYHAAVDALKERGVAPTHTAVADELGVSPKTAEHVALVANRSQVSLHQEIDENDEGETMLVLDVLGEEDREVQELEQRDLVQFFLSKLDETERQIFVGVFAEELKLTELSEQLGIERRKVAAIRDRAEAKMQLLAKMEDARHILTHDELQTLNRTGPLMLSLKQAQLQKADLEKRLEAMA